jgi:hypothetical protein
MLSSTRKYITPFFFLAAGVAALVMVLYLTRSVTNWSDRSTTVVTPDYDSGITVPTGHQGTPFEKKAPLHLQEVDISLRLQVRSFSEPGLIFDTAPGESGIRLEVSQPSSLLLTVAHGKTQGLRKLLVTDSLRAGKWQIIRLQIDKLQRLRVYVDDTELVSIVDPSIDFVLSTSTLSSRINESARFDGSFRDFRIMYIQSIPSQSGKTIARAVGILLFSALTVLSLLMFWRTLPVRIVFISGVETWIAAAVARLAGRAKIIYSAQGSVGAPVYIFACSLLLFFLLGFTERFEYQVIKTGTITDPGFDSRSTDPRSSSVKRFSESVHSSMREVDISFRFRAYSVSEWSNVLQTADGNAGIRLELANPSSLVLVTSYRNTYGFNGYYLTDSLETNKWYTVRIKAKSGRYLRAYLDGRQVVDVSDQLLNFRVSSIAIGSGYSQSRPLDGAVDGLQFTYILIRRLHTVAAIVSVLKWLLAVTMICSAVLLLIRSKNRRVGRFTDTGLRLWRNYVLPYFWSGSLGTVLVIACLSFLLLLLSPFDERFKYRTVKRGSITSASFDSRSSNPELSSIKEFRERTRSRLREVDIMFGVKAYSTSGSAPIFQTAPDNSGIRLEVRDPATLLLSLHDAGTGDLRGLVVTESFKLNQWHEMRLRADGHQRIKMDLDGVSVLDITDSFSKFDVSHISVGGNESARFDGAIRDLRFDYRFAEERPFLTKGLICLQTMIVVVFLIFSTLVAARLLRVWRLPVTVAKTRLFYTVLLFGSATTVCYFITNSAFFHLGYPFTSPLFPSGDRFMDFFNINLRAIADVRYSVLKSIVAPFGLLLARFFALFADYNTGSLGASVNTGDMTVATFVGSYWDATYCREQVAGLISLGLFAACFIAVIVLLSRKLAVPPRNLGGAIRSMDSVLIFVSLVLSYPVIFALDRGNYVILAFMFLFLFLYAPKQEAWFASLALAAAISIKPHFGIFLIALFGKKNARSLIQTLICLFLLNISSSIVLWDFGFFSSAVSSYGTFSNMLTRTLMAFSSPTIFSALYVGLHGLLTEGMTLTMISAYGPLSMVGIVGLSLLVRARISDLSMQFFYIAILIVILPIASYDYNLILLIVFLPVLVSTSEKEFGLAQMAMFALALVPSHYVTIGLEPYNPFWSKFGTYLRLTEHTIFTPVLLGALFITGLVRAPAQKRGSEGVPRALRLNKWFAACGRALD